MGGMERQVVIGLAGALVLAALSGSGAFGQTRAQKEREVGQLDERDRKLLSCRQNPAALVGLTRDALRAKCGIWARATLTVTAGGSRELITYGYGFEGGPFLLVEIEGGTVTAVRKL